MREIKFRAKDIKTNKWVYGGYYKHLKRTPCPIGDSIKDSDYEHLIVNSGFSDWNMPKPLNCFKVDEKTVGQYAGFRDKNGKEIYEGDICKELYKNGNETGSLLKILWSEYYKFDAKVIVGGTLTEGLNFPLWHWDKRKENGYRQLEILGNIYENPELLRA